MLWTIVVILLVLWLLGFLGYVGGGLIHLLIVIAVIIVITKMIQGRRIVAVRTGSAPRIEQRRPKCDEGVLQLRDRRDDFGSDPGRGQLDRWAPHVSKQKAGSFDRRKAGGAHPRWQTFPTNFGACQ